MKEIGLEELKSLQLEMLQKIHKFCVSNGIHYSLAAGTLLGAIRHKGYIPWDDDIDILMPRPDYERFLNSFNGYYPNLLVVAPELNWRFYAPYANVYDNRTILVEERLDHRGNDIGVKIDVFPIDGVPSDNTEYILFSKKMKETLRKIALKKWTRSNFIMTFKKDKIGFIVSLFNRLGICCKSYETLQKEYHELAVSHTFDNSEYVENIVYNTTHKFWRIERSCFDEYIEVPFENYIFNSIKGFDKYLIVSYGDYMQLPPEEQRTPHHGFTAYWK